MRMHSGPSAEAETGSEDPAGPGADQALASSSGPGYSSTNTRKRGSPVPGGAWAFGKGLEGRCW